MHHPLFDSLSDPSPVFQVQREFRKVRPSLWGMCSAELQGETKGFSCCPEACIYLPPARPSQQTAGQVSLLKHHCKSVTYRKRKTIWTNPHHLFLRVTVTEESQNLAGTGPRSHRVSPHPSTSTCHHLPTSWPAGSFVPQGVTSRCEEYKVLVRGPFIHLCPWAGVFLLSWSWSCQGPKSEQQTQEHTPHSLQRCAHPLL